MKLGTNDIGSVYLGTNEISKVYLGTNLVWESGFDADYQAVLDYATTQGYTLPSLPQQIKQNQLVRDLKSAGIWSKLDTFGVFATDGDSDFALIDWIRLIDYTAVNSPTFNVNEGFEGNGTSSYINLNYETDTDWNNVSQNSACLFAYAFAEVYPSNGILIGSSNNNLLNSRNPTNNITSRIHSSTLVSTPTTNGQGLTILNRNNSTSYDLYQRGSFIDNLLSNSVTANQPTYVMRYVSVYSPSKPSLVGYSSSLTSGEITDLTNSLDTYITSL
jgi:hypothetical protein